MMNRLLVVASLALPLPLMAQIRASEKGTVSQTVDGTTVTVEYSRPRARGRDPIFGTKAVKWGETWTPGANWATTLDVSKPVKLDGHAVPKGKYSVWMVVRKDANWTLVLDPEPHRFHMEPPDSAATQVRIPVHAEAAPFTDVLTWSMPALRIDGGTLEMRWERIRVPIDVTVEPSLVMTFPAAEAAQYVGEYSFIERGPAGKENRSVFTVSYEDGTLKGQSTPEDPYLKKFALIRIAPDWFAPGVYDDTGKIYEVLRPDVTVEFKREKGSVVGLSVRDNEDHLWGTGTRKR